ncbi:MAG: hypothetical protein DWQ01_00730 [Planctomycetota bacterium]|nr:MAG: hypothetical protein DWQ01_00730 [Planctomycetota bacterium]
MFVLALALSAQLGLVLTEDPVFMDDLGNSIQISTGDSVPMATSGHLLVPVRFQSDLFDSETQTYGIPEIKVVYSMIADGVPYSTYQAQDMNFVFGGSGRWPEVAVTSFDSVSGEGTASIFLPVFFNDEQGGWPFPDIGRNDVTLYWGSESDLFHTGQDPPSGAEGSISFSFMVSFPPVAVGVVETRSLAPGDSGIGFLAVELPALEDRRFLLTSGNPDILWVPSMVELPAGETFLTFGVQAINMGQASFSVVEEGGVGAFGNSSQLWIDGRTEVLSDSDPGADSEGDSGGYFNFRCFPAIPMNDTGPNEWRKCSRKCKILPFETPQLKDYSEGVPKGGTAHIMKRKADCYPRPFYKCYMYQRTLKNKKRWKLTDNYVDDCFSISFFVTVNLKRMCCVWMRVEGATENVVIDDCWGTGVEPKNGECRDK